MASYDDINTPAVAVVGVVSAIVIFAVIVGVQALYFTYQNAAIDQQNALRPDISAANLVAEQEARLQRKGWIDRKAGRLAIPIDRAMRLVVDQMQDDSSASEAHDET